MRKSNWVSDENLSGRRDFLVRSAKAVGASALLSSAGCSGMREPRIGVSAGAKPNPITPDSTLRIGLIGTGHRMRMLLEHILKQKNMLGMLIRLVFAPVISRGKE